MSEKTISIKYDGPSIAIQNHEIDIRVLAKALDSFADLIVAADEAINKQSSNARILVKAPDDSKSAFVAGSFGVELLVTVDPAVLKALGFVAGAVAGSLLSVLKDINSNQLQMIEVDESDPIAKLVLANGEIVETSKDVASLIASKGVRNTLAKLVHEPLGEEGISSFAVYDGALSDNVILPQYLVTDETKGSFKKPAMIQTTTKREVESLATVEFLAANKESGRSGWRMKYLSYDNVSVKVEDELFLEGIKNTAGAPKIFAEHFSVKMKTVVTDKNGEAVSEVFTITKVIGPKKP